MVLTSGSAYILVHTSSRRSPSFVISVFFWTVNSKWPVTLPRSQASVIISLDVWSKWEEFWEKTLQLVLCRLSLLDDCNAILAGLPQWTIAPFQRVQNAAITMVKRLGSRDHITEAQRNLHWLPIKYRVMYKLCIPMHLFHIGCGSGYISELGSPRTKKTTLFRRKPLWDPCDPPQYWRTSFLLCWFCSLEQFANHSY